MALVVVDVEGGRLLLSEGRQADVFPPLPAQLHRAPDHIGEPQTRLDFIEESFVEARHDSILTDDRRHGQGGDAETGGGMG